VQLTKHTFSLKQRKGGGFEAQQQNSI